MAVNIIVNTHPRSSYAQHLFTNMGHFFQLFRKKKQQKNITINIFFCAAFLHQDIFKNRVKNDRKFLKLPLFFILQIRKFRIGKIQN